ELRRLGRDAEAFRCRGARRPRGALRGHGRPPGRGLPRDRPARAALAAPARHRRDVPRPPAQAALTRPPPPSKEPHVQISPSILSADFANLESELDAISNADWAHVDVMDAHFVPNLTLGLPIVESLLRVSPIPIDCHLMIEDTERWAPPYADAGANSVTFPV